MSSVHDVALKGFGKGTNELYDRVRPGYQPVALQFIRNILKDDGPYNIAEIGAGTGIFTRALLADQVWSASIKELVAVEPSDGMRQAFEKSVHDDRVQLREGTFQDTGIEDKWADLVIIAQAFHWCPDYDRASAEFARILKPNGTVVCIWNLEDRDAARWVAQVRETIEQHESGSPQFRLNLWKQAFDTPSYKQFFHPPEERVWEYTLTATETIVVDRASSKSYIAILPADEKESVRQTIRDIIQKGEDKEWIDKDAGTFKYPYKTWLVTAQMY